MGVGVQVVLRVFLLLGAITIVGACVHGPLVDQHKDPADAVLDKGDGSPLVRLRELVALQDYAAANMLLSSPYFINSTDVDVVQGRAQALVSIQQFEQSILRQLDSLQLQNLWQQARELLVEAQKKLPGSQALAEASSALSFARQRRYLLLTRQLHLLRGHYLAESREILAEVALMEKRSAIKGWLSPRARQREIETTSRALVDCGKDAIGVENYTLAANCLITAEKISDEPEVQGQLSALNELQKKVRAQEISQANQQREELIDQQAQHIKKLKRTYRRAVRKGDWVSASNQMRTLQGSVPDDQSVKVWAADLERIVRAKVDFAIRQGKLLYTKGYVYRALSVWKEAAILKPQSEQLQAHITRAERFLENLNRLAAENDQQENDGKP